MGIGRVREGRDRRVDRSRAKILGATERLLIQNGVAAFTIDAVIQAAGVARSTIYRHWPTRDELITEAIAGLGEPAPAPDTGSLRGDLLAFFLARTRFMEGGGADPRLQSLPGLMEAARRDPRLSALITHASTGNHRSLCGLLARGQARGEIRAGLNLDTAANLLLGALYIRRGYLNQPMSDAYVTDMVDTALTGVAPATALAAIPPRIGG